LFRASSAAFFSLALLMAGRPADVIGAARAGSAGAAGSVGASPVVVGLLLPPEEPEALSIRQGARAAVEEANEAAAGGGVRIVERGKKGAWGSDASEAALLVMDDGAQALLAPTGGAATHLVLQVSGRTALPVASLCPDASVTRASIPWMVRVAPSTLDEAKTIFGGVPASIWLAFVPEGRAGREASSDLTAAAAAAPAGKRSIGKVVATGDGVIPDGKLRSTLASARPEAVLLWLPPAAAGRMARSLRAAGFKGPIAGPSSLGSRFFAAEAGPSAEGILVPVVDPDAAASAFGARYRRLFGTDPDQAAALAHDAALLLIRALRRADSQGSERSLTAGEPFRGATGLLAFDRHGNRLVQLRLSRYRSGRLASL
jgi:ABC-type branched-subunit amino acid transport system substrate-binding protein